MPQIRANGIRLEYDDVGEPASPPVVLVMGLGAQMIRWPDSFRHGLVDAGYRVIRFDNRDSGLSEKCDAGPPVDLARVLEDRKARRQPNVPYLLADMARDTVGLLDALSIPRAHVMGASMGGMIAQMIAINHPERMRSLISIMSTTSDPALPPPTDEAQKALMSRPRDASLEAVIDNARASNRVIGSPGYPQTEDELRSRVAAEYQRGYFPRGFINQYAAIIASGSRTRALRYVTVPALVVHGADDPLVPLEAGQHTAQSIPNAQLAVIEGMGHDLPEALMPVLLATVIPFLDAVEKRQRRTAY